MSHHFAPVHTMSHLECPLTQAAREKRGHSSRGGGGGGETPAGRDTNNASLTGLLVIVTPLLLLAELLPLLQCCAPTYARGTQQCRLRNASIGEETRGQSKVLGYCCWATAGQSKVSACSSVVREGAGSSKRRRTWSRPP